MTHLEATKERLTEYVRALVTQPLTRLDLRKLQHLEDEIESATLTHTYPVPFR